MPVYVFYLCNHVLSAQSYCKQSAFGAFGNCVRRAEHFRISFVKIKKELCWLKNRRMFSVKFNSNSCNFQLFFAA